MAEPIPRWLMEKYAVLYRNYKDKSFTFKDAMKTLKEKDKVYISLALSEMRKSGWLTIKINPDDARKRLYNLILPEEVINQIKEEKN